MNKQIKKIFIKIVYLIILFLAFYGAFALLYTTEKKVNITVFPYDLGNQTEFACSTKIGTTLFPDPNWDKKTFETFKGSLFTNDKTKMAIKIKDKTLEMITSTSVEAGTSDPAKLVILRETKDAIVAVDAQDDVAANQGVGTFILNKRTGTAVWTKSKPTLLSNNMPDTQAYFMECR